MSGAPRIPIEASAVDGRVVRISLLAILLAAFTSLAAVALLRLIALVTNLAFFGRVSFSAASPAGNALGWGVILVPVLGGLVVGLMARFGSAGIRGHGIPEAMEQILMNRSRIAPRLTILKPISAAISIGTGGPFGAEGPIIATGGAFGSLVGQFLAVTTEERKTLLAAGAAAGMTATFSSPVAGVLLAVELLLFEFRARSLVPVALACAAAAAVRSVFLGGGPMFPMPLIASPGSWAIAFYVALGALVGLAAVVVTRATYFVEDLFEKIPVHWMWWPAIGAVAVGAIGWMVPHTLGVGYENLDDMLSGRLPLAALAVLCIAKFFSWAIALGSGTSGGTLAPLFTIGGALGAALAGAAAAALPGVGIDPRVGALVGMAAMFAGASRALLASIVFAFEVTRQPLGLLPLLAGCSASYLLSALLMDTTIMTEKIVRHGVRAPADLGVDYLARVHALSASHPADALLGDLPVAQARIAIRRLGHQGYPVVDASGRLEGVVTRRDLDEAPDSALLRSRIRGTPVVVFEDSTLREAADHMVRHGVGRLPVVARADPSKVLGILTRSDLLGAHKARLDEEEAREQGTFGRGARRRLLAFRH